MTNGQRFEAGQDRVDEKRAVVARQGRLALGWVVAIMIMVALIVLLVVALMLRSGWWIDEGPVAAMDAPRWMPVNERGGAQNAHESATT